MSTENEPMSDEELMKLPVHAGNTNNAVEDAQREDRYRREQALEYAIRLCEKLADDDGVDADTVVQDAQKFYNFIVGKATS